MSWLVMGIGFSSAAAVGCWVGIGWRDEEPEPAEVEVADPLERALLSSLDGGAADRHGSSLSGG